MKEVIVTRKGQITIPAEYRKKYNIEVGDRVLIEDTGRGLLLKPIPSLEELAGADVGRYETKEMKRMLDEMREEWR